jgi:hypothetical protein
MKVPGVEQANGPTLAWQHLKTPSTAFAQPLQFQDCSGSSRCISWTCPYLSSGGEGLEDKFAEQHTSSMTPEPATDFQSGAPGQLLRVSDTVRVKEFPSGQRHPCLQIWKLRSRVQGTNLGPCSL